MRALQASSPLDRHEDRMPKFASAHAKNHFGELINAARAAPVAITKYDRMVVVMVAAEEFERMRAMGGTEGSTVGETQSQVQMRTSGAPIHMSVATDRSYRRVGRWKFSI
jgi:prevent-host-death family protein